jgi:hypothetical protein
MKEGIAYGVQIYFENNCQVLVPTEQLEQAIFMGDPKSIYQRVNLFELKQYMAMVFDQSNPESAAQKSPYVVVENFNL